MVPQPACPECGTPLRGVNEVQLQEHIDHNYPIICGDCAKSFSALEWRDGKAPALEPEVIEPEVIEVVKEERRYGGERPSGRK